MLLNKRRIEMAATNMEEHKDFATATLNTTVHRGLGMRI